MCLKLAVKEIFVAPPNFSLQRLQLFSHSFGHHRWHQSAYGSAVCTLLPVHCPVNQLINAVGGMWDMVASGQMKHVERTFILLSGIQWEVELYARPAAS